jgi:hypothetical protein
MAIRAIFNHVRWTDRNGGRHQGHFLATAADIRRAAKDTGMTIVSIERVRDADLIRELSFRSLSEDRDILARTAERRTAVRKARAKATRTSRREALKSLGLRQVRGALGGTYWE